MIGGGKLWEANVRTGPFDDMLSPSDTTILGRAMVGQKTEDDEWRIKSFRQVRCSSGVNVSNGKQSDIGLSGEVDTLFIVIV